MLHIAKYAATGYAEIEQIVANEQAEATKRPSPVPGSFEHAMAQAGLHIPNFRELLESMVGKPMTNDIISKVENHPDPAKFVQELFKDFVPPGTKPAAESASTATAPPPGATQPSPPPPPASPSATAAPPIVDCSDLRTEYVRRLQAEAERLRAAAVQQPELLLQAMQATQIARDEAAKSGQSWAPPSTAAKPPPAPAPTPAPAPAQPVSTATTQRTDTVGKPSPVGLLITRIHELRRQVTVQEVQLDLRIRETNARMKRLDERIAALEQRVTPSAVSANDASPLSPEPPPPNPTVIAASVDETATSAGSQMYNQQDLDIIAAVLDAPHEEVHAAIELVEESSKASQAAHMRQLQVCDEIDQRIDKLATHVAVQEARLDASKHEDK